MEPSPLPATPIPAPKRRRWRIIGALVGLMLAIAVGGYYFRSWQADREWESLLATIEAEDPNWRYPALEDSRAKIPDAENSAKQVLRIRELLKATPFDLANNGWRLFDDLPASAQLNSTQIEVLQAAFAKLDPRILPETDKLADMPRGRYPHEIKDNPFLTVEHTQESRAIVNLLQNLAFLQSQTNDTRAAMRSCQALFQVERSIGDHPTLIGQLVRMAEQAVAIKALERALAQGVATEAELASLQALVEKDIGEPLVYFGMRGERGGHELFARKIKHGTVKASELFALGRTAGTGGPDLFERMMDQFPGIIERQFADCVRICHEYTKISKLPPEEMLDAYKALEPKLFQASMIAKLLIPATHKVGEAYIRTQAMLRCTRASLAAERYRLKEGRWPESLEELVKAKLLSDLPVDPYDGKAIRTKRVADGFLFYSVNRDKVDNGGALDNNPMAPNTDLGVRLWNTPARRQPALPVKNLGLATGPP